MTLTSTPTLDTHPTPITRPQVTHKQRHTHPTPTPRPQITHKQRHTHPTPTPRPQGLHKQRHTLTHTPHTHPTSSSNTQTETHTHARSYTPPPPPYTPTPASETHITTQIFNQCKSLQINAKAILHACCVHRYATLNGSGIATPTRCLVSCVLAQKTCRPASVV